MSRSILNLKKQISEIGDLKYAFGGATLTVNAEGESDDITVNIQLEDADGNPIEQVAIVDVFVSGVATGDAIVGTAPDGGVVAGTDGAVLAPVTAGKYLICATESDGDLDLVITESGSATFYVCVRLPDGRVVVSDAVAF